MPYDSSGAWLTEAIDSALRRLNTDRIDLYQIHRPDLLTHPAELARTLERAHAAGKIRAVGISNYSCAQGAALADALTIPLASHQLELSPLCIQPLLDGRLDQAMAHDQAVLAWSPLAGGRLAAPEQARDQAVATLLDEMAQDAGVGRAAAACAWLMAHPSRPIPILGTQNADHVRAATDAYRVRWPRAAWYHVLETALGSELP
jgi:predicted oxidoreductase